MKTRLLIFCLLIASLSALQAVPLTLEQFLLLVEENNKDIYSADLDVSIARTQRDLARSLALPMIGGSLGYTRNFLEIKTPAPVGAIYDPSTPAGGLYNLFYTDVPYNTDNEFTAGVGLQQTLFDMTMFQALKASSAYADLAGSVYEATRQAVLTAAKKLYVQGLLLEEILAVRKAAEENAYDSFRQVSLRYENELASQLDLLQAEVNYQIQIPETSQARRNRDLVFNTLKMMAGISIDEEILLTETLSVLPTLPEHGTFSEILTVRSDYQALVMQEDLQKLNVKAVQAEFYPTVSLALQYGWQASSNSFSLDDGISVLTAGINVNIPIFYGGSRFAKLEKAELELRKSRTALDKKREEMHSEIRNIELLLNESQQRITSAKRTLETAEKAYEIVEISVENGLATQFEMKEARLNLSSAQLNSSLAAADYLDAYFQWQQAMGRGDEPLR